GGTGPTVWRTIGTRPGRQLPLEGPRHPATVLHRVEGLVDLDVPAALENRAALGHGRRRVERVRLEDGVARDRRRPAIADGPAGSDRLRRAAGIAAVDDGPAQTAEPRTAGR